MLARAIYSIVKWYWLPALWFFLLIPTIYNARLSVMDPNSQEELIRGPGDAECSNRNACGLSPGSISCEPISAGTLQYRDLLRHLLHFQALSTRSNICLLPRTITSEPSSGEIQVDLAQISTIELRSLSASVLQEIHCHGQERHKQYDLTPKERAHRIAVVTNATRIIQEKLAQGAQLFE